MSGTIIWGGPVSTSNLKSVNLPSDWEIVTIAQEVVAPNQTGGVALKPSQFTAWVNTLGSDPLTAILKRGKNPNPDQVILAAFSAGAGYLDPVLSFNGEDDRIIGVYSADAYYGLAVKTGYLKYAKHALATGKPFWLSTSDTKGGAAVHSGAESVAPFADALGLVATDSFPVGMPQPDSSKNLQNVWWLNYGSKYSHVQHATVLCPTALNLWFSGQLGTTGPIPSPPGPTNQPPNPSDSGPSNSLPSAPSSSTPWGSVGWFALGAAAGYVGYRLVTGR